MGSDESHFNVSVGSDGQSHRTVSTNHNLFEEKGEPKRVSNRGPSAYQPNALPLGQTGSQMILFQVQYCNNKHKVPIKSRCVTVTLLCLWRFCVILFQVRCQERAGMWQWHFYVSDASVWFCSKFSTVILKFVKAVNIGWSKVGVKGLSKDWKNVQEFSV